MMNLNRFRRGKVSEFRKAKSGIIILVLLSVCGVVMGGFSSAHGAEKRTDKDRFYLSEDREFCPDGDGYGRWFQPIS